MNVILILISAPQMVNVWIVSALIPISSSLAHHTHVNHNVIMLLQLLVLHLSQLMKMVNDLSQHQLAQILMLPKILMCPGLVVTLVLVLMVSKVTVTNVKILMNVMSMEITHVTAKPHAIIDSNDLNTNLITFEHVRIISKVMNTLVVISMNVTVVLTPVAITHIAKMMTTKNLAKPTLHVHVLTAMNTMNQ